MLGRLNQLDLPEFFERSHWLREVVCVSEPYVEGELTLYPDGDCRIGTRVFRAGVPIDDWPFAGGYIAKRHLDRPAWLVIRTPAGVHHYYRYRRFVGMWERYTPFEDPVLDEYVQNFGPRLGSLFCGLGRATTGAGQHLVRVFLAMLSLGVGHLYLCFVVSIVIGVMMALSFLMSLIAG